MDIISALALFSSELSIYFSNRRCFCIPEQPQKVDGYHYSEILLIIVYLHTHKTYKCLNVNTNISTFPCANSQRYAETEAKQYSINTLTYIYKYVSEVI